jgi:hypothetical protein
MLTPTEKRFLLYWKDQKQGGKWKYILGYTIAWGIVTFFVPLGLSVVINIYDFFGLYKLHLWAAILISLAIGFAISLYIWDKNERREKMLLEKQGETGTV